MHNRPYLIGIAGPSCSGKTSLAQRLAEDLRAELITLDAYYRDLSGLDLAERCQANFDEPAALDWDLLISQMTALSEGRAIGQPVYLFPTHTRSREIRQVQPGGFVIVEGLFTLYREEVRRLFGTKVFMTLDHAYCLSRRIERDTTERGRSTDSVIAQYAATVRPMADQYVIPTQSFADLVLSGTEPVQKNAAAVLARVAPFAGSPRYEASAAKAR